MRDIIVNPTIAIRGLVRRNVGVNYWKSFRVILGIESVEVGGVRRAKAYWPLSARVWLLESSADNPAFFLHANLS